MTRVIFLYAYSQNKKFTTKFRLISLIVDHLLELVMNFMQLFNAAKFCQELSSLLKPRFSIGLGTFPYQFSVFISMMVVSFLHWGT